MRIPADVVEQIRSTANIVEVISDFVSLKKRGTNWTACCPFHAERTPSFAVSQSKNIFKCFGCGKGGDSVSFIMEIENISYQNALRYLARKYDIHIKEQEEYTPEDLEAEHERESLLALHKFAQEFYADVLLHHQDGQAIGLSYCKERGFLLPAIERFGLGFALPAWTALVDAARKRGFSKEILEKSGLTAKRDDGSLLDRFRDRFIFPIHNTTGEVIAFGARTLSSDKKVAKYLNSPETPIYHKSHVLYGLFQAKKAIREQDNCYLVEGYADVISLHQAGIENVVASSGTSLTVEQVRILRRFTENVTVLYDSDAAGIKASLRGIDILLEEKLNVDALHLPNGHDPDSFVRKEGALAMQNYLKEHRQNFITFILALLEEDLKKNPLAKPKLLSSILPTIGKIPKDTAVERAKRNEYIKQCAKIFDYPFDYISGETAKYAKEGNYSKKVNLRASEANTLIPSGAVERQTIRLLLTYGQEWAEENVPLMFFALEETKEISFKHPLYAFIFEKMREYKTIGKVLIAEDLIKEDNQEVVNFLSSYLFDKETTSSPLSPNWEEKFSVYTPEEKDILPKLLSEVILRLKFFHLDKLIAENEAQILLAESEEAIDECLIVKQQLLIYKKQIAHELRMVVK